MENTAVEKVGFDVWNAIRDFLGFELFTYDQGNSNITITVGMVLLIIIALILTKYALKAIYLFATRKLNDEETLRFKGVYNFVSYFIYLFVFISILSISGVDITIILTAAAVFFVGLGLAMREIFQDIIGGLYIMTDKTIMPGDVIEIQGEASKVIEITLRTTRVITREERILIIPNHKFITDVFFNYTQTSRTVRAAITIRIPLHENLDLTEKVLLDAASKNTHVLKNPAPFVMLDNFGEYAYELSLNVFITNSYREPRILSSIRYDIVKMMKENHLQIAIPYFKIDEQMTNFDTKNGTSK
ncbi:MAG TPA: mechanosensitive ion channel family protein [Flavobacterium sp.]|nr:mechanosensitive ion channel family protein [Flavobacterium sp.]